MLIGDASQSRIVVVESPKAAQAIASAERSGGTRLGLRSSDAAIPRKGQRHRPQGGGESRVSGDGGQASVPSFSAPEIKPTPVVSKAVSMD